MTDTKTQAVIYTRFSPRRNADESESCEVQEAICREHATKHGYDVSAVFHDPDVSGKDEYREKLWQAIEATPKGGMLLVFKRDRLARNVYLSEQINRAVEHRKARIEAVSGDVAGTSDEAVMIRQVLSSIAEYERKMIGKRTSYAMRQHQKAGRRMSDRTPCGWTRNPANPALMVRDEGEQAAISRIVEMRAEGLSLRQIADTLTAQGLLFRGHPWSHQTVRNVIARVERAAAAS